jgi:hypothetical protein
MLSKPPVPPNWLMEECCHRQVATVALDADAMAVCQRLRDTGQCVLDSWNTSRLSGEWLEGRLRRAAARL